jgi:hypothetical protein
MDSVPTQTAGTSELLASDWNTYVRDNFDSIKFGHVVCTSSTRPTGIGEGTMIYETDTNKVLVYNGSSWKEVSDLDSADGLSASGQTKLDSSVNGSDYATSQSILTTAFDTNYRSVTITATGRPIIVLWSCHISNLNSGAARTCEAQLYKGTSGVDSIGSGYAVANNDTRFFASHYIDAAPTAGSITYNLRAKCDTASACGILRRRLDVFEI